MTAANLAYLFVALVLVLVNGFFVLAEFAIVKVRATRLEELARSGSRNAETARQIIRRLDVFLSATQLGITLASLGLGWIGEPAFAHVIEAAIGDSSALATSISHAIAVAIAFVLITFLHIVLGELAPKYLAIRHADSAALFVARPLRVFRRLFAGPLWVLNFTANAVLRMVGIARPSATEMAHSEEELRMILGASQQQGVVSLGRLLLIENIFDFGRIQARQVMLPREKVVFLRVEDAWEVNREKIRQSAHTRFPLCKKSLDDVVGMVHFKDVGIHLMSSATSPDLGKIARDVLFAREDQSIELLMRDFKARRRHMAIVKNPAGKVSGIVTLEDVLEELVGNIEDEFDRSKSLLLSELVGPNLVFLDFEAEDSRSAIREIVRRAAEAGAIANAAAATAAVLKREASIPSALGEGVALPHARVEGLERPILAMARPVKPIDFDAFDDLPVSLVFLALTPARDDATHLGVLARIAKLLESDYLREQLLHADSPEMVIGILRVADREISV
jgi:magnesium and cobalt exporter, CNNM family